MSAQNSIVVADVGESSGWSVTLRATGRNAFVNTSVLILVVEDNVLPGCCTRLRNTVIGAGTRLDNLVQVAHNVHIGRHCAIAAQVGISGSVEIGDFVVIGGQAGIAEHMRIGPKARVGAQSGVMSVIRPGEIVVGSPARSARDFFREIATLKKLVRR